MFGGFRCFGFLRESLVRWDGTVYCADSFPCEFADLVLLVETFVSWASLTLLERWVTHFATMDSVT